jgi:hypothetical protein
VHGGIFRPGARGANGAGNPIVGTPANLGDGTDEDTSGGAPGLAGLCGFGILSVMPVMLAGLWLMRASVGRRLRRTV